MDNLKAKAANKNTKASICKGLPLIMAGISAKLMVPVAPYISEIPNNKIPEEKADERINFMDASEDIFFCRSKFAIAATGIVESSRAKKNMSRLPLEIIKNMPSTDDNISIKNSGMFSLFFNQSENNNEIR